MNELGNTPADNDYKPSGISKAEELAMQAYPNMTFPFTPLDLNAYRREAFINGYEVAEKDLALTWEDIKTITEIADSMLTGTAWDVIDWPDEQKYYEEVLKRFKEARK